MPPEILSPIGLISTLLAVGAAGGFLSGLLGVGGGIIFVPALYFILVSFASADEAAIHVAIGTSAALILGTSVSSAFWHHKKGSVDFSILKRWGPTAVAGVAVGTCLASAVDGHFLKRLFASLMLLICLYMALSKEPSAGSPVRRVSTGLQRTFSAFVGVISALLGVGGATLNIPFMVYMGVSMPKAVGTGSALAIAIALPAMTGYIVSGLHAPQLPPYSLGYVNMLALAAIMPTAMLLSPVGVHLSHKLPRNILRRIFAAVLMIVSIRMFIS